MTVRPTKRGMAPAPILATGVVSALCGTGVAHMLGVADTPGADWTELALQMLMIGVGLGLLAVAGDLTGDHRKSGGSAGPTRGVSAGTATGRRPAERQGATDRLRRRG